MGLLLQSIFQAQQQILLSKSPHMGLYSLCLICKITRQYICTTQVGCTGIYVGYSPFHSGSVSLVLNPATGHLSPQFHVLFDDELSTVPFMKEGTIPPNWTDLVQRSSQSGSPDNIDLRDTWFNQILSKIPAKLQLM